MKGKIKNQQSKRYNKKLDSNSTKFTCFGCGKQGHMKVDCPSLVNKEKAHEKKSNKSRKGRKAYIAWEDNATSSNSSSLEDVEVNLCLMARENFEVSNSSTSFNSTNYSSLLQAFFDTREEANRLALSNNRLKGLNNWLEGRIKELEDELLKLKTDFDYLEIIYKASNIFDSSKPINCENCVVLQKKVNYLITTTSPWELRISMPFWVLKIVFLKRLALDIKVVFKERKRNSIVSLKPKSNSFHLS